ncbi:MAG: DUF402 domain-containing protein [Candidatus Marinimicrobia bacterium]|nr:DUF402 domain-containing protein [Candidatus Neomarinimicrobiota bacterium]
MKVNCKEIKKHFKGDHQEYDCQLLTINNGMGILKYILEENHKVVNVKLEPGDLTYGFYWEEQSYNLYKWKDPAGRLKGNYFNIADRIKLTKERFAWRDLILDILITPDNEVYVIDEDEIPNNINRRVKEYIYTGKRYILQNYPGIIAETDRKLENII